MIPVGDLALCGLKEYDPSGGLVSWSRRRVASRLVPAATD